MSLLHQVGNLQSGVTCRQVTGHSIRGATLTASKAFVETLELTNMADQAELAFVNTLLNTLSTQPVNYGDDYQQPPQNSLKKIPVMQVNNLITSPVLY